MGLKWFRAQMALDEPRTLNPTGAPGFYRTISNFDASIWPPPPTMVQKPRPVAKPVSPPHVPTLQSPQNSMPTLDAEDLSSEYKRDSGLSEGEHEGAFKLPRASVDILREKHTEDVKKAGIKKKKGNAPKPYESVGNSSAREVVI
ncbi:uncharacterized protein LOC107038391 [Diachasma alloeum]|uniref:uncharacterized protein LOC107038391 n=1 Tax=Diachasma alloeum TaxID=454923 RepID=UPI0007383DE2|nr:uncharacterized protein LOC107038391 [Diachasma alloeum]